MPKNLYLIIIKNPYLDKPFTFGCNDKEYLYDIDFNDIDSGTNVISYGFENLIDYIRSNKETIDYEIVDTKTLQKLLVGKPKREFKGSYPWELRSIIGQFADEETLSWLKDIYGLKNLAPNETNNFSNLLKNLMESFVESYKYQISQLIIKSEKDRFFNIENPIYNTFIKTQLTGIRVSQDKLYKRLNTLKKEYYKAIKKLEFNFNFSSHNISFNMSWEDIKDYCHIKGFEGEFNYNFWNTVEILQEQDQFLELLWTARYSDRDYTELLKYKIDTYKNVYPEFDIIGTVTSRILVNKPGIQYLKKRNRDIFIPSEDMSFIYADFDQFEPGILTHFSQDNKLKSIYDKSDIYDELSIILFSDVKKRKISKVIFLSYMYGMKKDNILQLLEQLTDKESCVEGMKFFEHFKKLKNWKEELIKSSEKNGFSQSLIGNKRYLSKIGESSNYEKRWIPNQLIQGTASLILKSSIIELRKRFSYINFLIPMHDAILIEVPTKKITEIKADIKKIFEDKFTEYCPSISTSISFEVFG